MENALSTAGQTQTEATEPNQLQEGGLPGVISLLGQLGASAVITEEALANLFGRHVTSVKRAVQRGELPRPARLFGGNAWTVGAIIRHLEARMESAAKEAEQTSRRLANLEP